MGGALPCLVGAGDVSGALGAPGREPQRERGQSETERQHQGPQAVGRLTRRADAATDDEARDGRPGAPGASAPSVDSTLGTKLLPSVLGLTAGAVDVIGFLGLGGLFTAHITGNLVILAAHLVSGGVAPVAHILSVPVFVAALGLTRLLAGGADLAVLENQKGVRISLRSTTQGLKLNLSADGVAVALK